MIAQVPFEWLVQLRDSLHVFGGLFAARAPVERLLPFQKEWIRKVQLLGKLFVVGTDIAQTYL